MVLNTQVSQQQTEQGPLKKAIRVLSIDGGGIRGVAVAEILHGIEERLGEPIHKLFDVIVGTSTGGLLAVMLSVEIPAVPEKGAKKPHTHCSKNKIDKDPKKQAKNEEEKTRKQVAIRELLGLETNKGGDVLTAAQARDLYTKKASEIFHEDAGFFHRQFAKLHDYVDKGLHWFSAKYDKGENLKEIVRALYINNSFEQARTCAGVVVTERGFGMPLLLNSTNAKVQGRHNYHNTLSLAKLVRATSAAPTYFKSMHIHNPVVAKGGDKKQDVLDNEKRLTDASSSHWAKELMDHKFCQRQTLFFEDGGVTCNNPSVKAFKYAKDLLKLHGEDPKEYQFQVYSFGTGASQYDEADPAHEIIRGLEVQGGKVESGNWDSINRLVFNDPFNIERMSYKNHHKIQQKLKLYGDKTGIEQKYFRLQFLASKEDLAKLDDSSEGHIKRLIGFADRCMRENKVYEAIITSLKTPVLRPEGLNKVMPNIKPEDSKLFECPLGFIKEKSDACELTSQEQ